MINIYERTPRFEGDDNPLTNGEIAFYRSIVDECQIIVSAGARGDELWIREKPALDYHLFEPQPKAHEQLLALFKKCTNVYLNKAALAERPGTSSYYEDTQSLVRRSAHTTSRAISYNVHCVTLDEYCRQHRIAHIDFLKLDVEGMEVGIIRGAREMLSRCRYVQFEYGGTYLDAGTTLAEMYRLLNERDIYLVEHHGLNRMRTPVENYSYANYVAIATKKPRH